MEYGMMYEGNLALSLDEAMPVARPRLEVVAGGRRERAALDIPRNWSVAILAVTFAVLLFTLGSSLYGAIEHRAAIEGIEYAAVTVSAGDTIWELANEHPVEGLGAQELASIIKDANGLGSYSIHPGQTLLVPVSQ